MLYVFCHVSQKLAQTWAKSADPLAARRVREVMSRALALASRAKVLMPEGSIPHARWLATKGLDSVKGLPKPKSATLKRRKSFDPALHDPFLANALGGGMSAADNQIRKFMNEGGFEGLDGAGKPLKERNMGPFVSREEAVLNDMVEHLSKERDGLNQEDKDTFRRSAVRSEVAEKLRNRK